MADKMMRIAARDKEGNAKAITVDEKGNLNINLSTADVAIPVDLQYQDLAEPLPVRIDGEFVVIKELNNIKADEHNNPISFFVGKSPSHGSRNIEALYVGGYKEIVIEVINNTGTDIDMRGLFYATTEESSEYTSMAASKQMENTFGDGERGFLTMYGYASGFADEGIIKNEGLKTLENPPLPYMFVQVRNSAGEKFEEGSISVIFYGVKR